MHYCSLQHQTSLPSPVTSTTGQCFHFGSITSFFLELFLHSSPVAYWAPSDLGSSSLSTRISHASKVMLKIVQARLQQYVNLQMFKLDLKRQRNQRLNCQHLLDHRTSKRLPEKHLLLPINYTKALDGVDHNKLWKIPQEMGIPDYLTCFLSNLYAGEEAIVRTGHGTTDWFQIGKGVRQVCILSPAYLIYMQST